jgi:hypothetical protein
LRGIIILEMMRILINAEQAARELDRDPVAFRRWAAEGQVEGVVKVGSIWVAEYAAWKAATEKIRKPGPKPKRT